MAKALPLKLWLELEDDVARHKAEITRLFTEARARLLPPPPVAPKWNDSWASYLDGAGAAAVLDDRLFGLGAGLGFLGL